MSEVQMPRRGDRSVGKRHRRETVLDYLDRNAADHSGVVATVDGDVLVTWSEYRRRTRAIALALLDLGVAGGQVIGLHMVNRAEHVQSDLGALTAGATPTSFYDTLAEEQLAYVAGDSAAAVVIVDATQLPKWLAIRARLPALRHLLVLDLDPSEPLPPGVLRFEDCVDEAEARLDERGAEVDQARARIQAGDPLTIVYTSGTTGPPKGTIITHTTAVWVMDKLHRILEKHLGGPTPVGWTTVSYLPLAHIAERNFSHYGALAYVQTVHYVRDQSGLPHVLALARPHIFLGVPGVWERMHGTIREQAATAKNPLRRWLASTAISVAQKIGAARLGGVAAGVWARMLHPVLERLVYPRIRGVLGLDRVAFALSGAAQLAPDVHAFFTGIGIAVTVVYGMTESCAIITASPLHAPRSGTVGRPLPGIELKIASDGEVLVRGPNITPGYLNQPAATAETIDAEGWLHTGDVGALDDEGYLRLTGRKNDLINTATGKTLSPANVEVAMAQGSDLIGSVYVHGDDKPCLVALVTLDPSAWPRWCQARGIEVSSLSDAVRNGRVRLEVAQSIGAGNMTLSQFEQVKNWTLLEELWGVQTGELSPTMKLKRSVIAERYRDEIEELYDPLTINSWID
jgi:long-chain acyl-CoA synthetase